MTTGLLVRSNIVMNDPMARLGTITVVCFAFFLHPVNGSATPGNDTVAQQSIRCSFLTVRSETEQLRIYLDSSYLGLTPLDSICTVAGRHLLQCIPIDPVRWNDSPVIDTVECVPGRLTEKRIHFPRHIFIASEPYGAFVTGNGKIIGETPLWLSVYDPGSSYTISKNGYKDSSFFFTADTFFALRPINDGMYPIKTVNLSQSASNNDLPIYLTAAAALISGASAAYFKIKADNLNSDYGITGNAADLSRIHHNDTIAGISLAVCQVNLIGLAYLLFSR